MAHFIAPDKKIYVDTEFVQKSQRLPGMTLNHMGFGEFTLKSPTGEIEFDRMRGKKFEGQSGRSHQFYDSKGGQKAAEAVIKMMEAKGLSTRVASTTEGKTMNKQAANNALGRLDKLAGYIQKNHEKLGMSFDDAKALVNDLDKTADEIETMAFGETSLKRRQAEVIQRDPDEPYMDTFNAPMAPKQTDADEPYMDAYQDDESKAVDDGKDEDGRPLNPN